MSESMVDNQTKETGATPTDLKSNLKEIFETGMDTYGHGTRIEAAEEIIKGGLMSRAPDLTTTAVHLFDHSNPFEEQIDDVMAEIRNWQHLDSKAIVIIMLPAFKRPSPPSNTIKRKSGVMPIAGMKYQIRTFPFFREIPGEHDASFGLPYVLPPNYIRGFVDVAKNEFIENPLFDPKQPERTVLQQQAKQPPPAPARQIAENTFPNNPDDELF